MGDRPDGVAQSPRYARTWQAAHEVGFSSTLRAVHTRRTRLEPTLTVEAVGRARREAEGDLTIEGPILAEAPLALGVVDVVELLLRAVMVGGGTGVSPAGVRERLRLTRQRCFSNGMVQVTYEKARWRIVH